MPDESERPYVVLHLGAHKTGTSLVQKFLRDQPKVVEGLNVHYIGRTATNTLIGWGDFVIKKPHRLSGALDEAPGSARAVILSHENSIGHPIDGSQPDLYPAAAACAKALRDATAGYDVRVVYHIRAQESFLESYYLQTVHQGQYGTFGEWIAGIDLDQVSWVPAISALQAAFGPEHVHVIDFATIAAGQHKFLTDFLDIATPGHNVDISYGATRNPSVSAQGLRIALDVNPLLETAKERAAMRKFLQKHFNNRKGDRPTLFSEEQKDQLSRRYSGENADLCEASAGPSE